MQSNAEDVPCPVTREVEPDPVCAINNIEFQPDELLPYVVSIRYDVLACKTAFERIQRKLVGGHTST
jgi:hypothetical protein